MSHFGRAGPPDIRDTYSLLVLNITFRTSADDLFPLFDRYGKVVDVFIPRDRRTGESRGFAFVRYKHADEAQKAIERLDGRNVDGRDIVVQYAKYGRNDEAIHQGRITQGSPNWRSRSRSRSPRHGRSSNSRASRENIVSADVLSSSPYGRDYQLWNAKHRGREYQHRSRCQDQDERDPYQDLERRCGYQQKSSSNSPSKSLSHSPSRTDSLVKQQNRQLSHNRSLLGRASPATSRSPFGVQSPSQSPTFSHSQSIRSSSPAEMRSEGSESKVARNGISSPSRSRHESPSQMHHTKNVGRHFSLSHGNPAEDQSLAPETGICGT